MSSDKQGYIFTLGPELLKKANKELNEKDKHRKRDIQVLRERVLANKGMIFFSQLESNRIYTRLDITMLKTA